MSSALLLGSISSLLYVGWAISYLWTDEKHMTGALLCYGTANVFLMWPLIRTHIG